VLFVFVNRKGNDTKARVWDRTGFALYAKRLEGGRFTFPSEAESQELSERHFVSELTEFPCSFSVRFINKRL
jgi:transposase